MQFAAVGWVAHLQHAGRNAAADDQLVGAVGQCLCAAAASLVFGCDGGPGDGQTAGRCATEGQAGNRRDVRG